MKKQTKFNLYNNVGNKEQYRKYCYCISVRKSRNTRGRRLVVGDEWSKEDG